MSRMESLATEAEVGVKGVGKSWQKWRQCRDISGKDLERISWYRRGRPREVNARGQRMYVGVL